MMLKGGFADPTQKCVSTKVLTWLNGVCPRSSTGKHRDRYSLL